MVKGLEAGSPRTHSLPRDLSTLVRQRRETSLLLHSGANPRLLDSRRLLLLNQRTRRSPGPQSLLCMPF